MIFSKNSLPFLAQQACRQVLLLLVCVFLAATDCSAEREAPYNFKISAPSSWTYVDASVMKESQERLPDSELKELLKGVRPVVTILRYPPDKFTGPNPSVTLFILEDPDLAPGDLLKKSIATIKNLVADFKLEKDVHEVAANGVKASAVTLAFTQRKVDGSDLERHAHIRVFRRGRFLYTLGTSSLKNPSAELQKDFDLILSSFQFEDK